MLNNVKIFVSCVMIISLFVMCISCSNNPDNSDITTTMEDEKYTSDAPKNIAAYSSYTSDCYNDGILKSLDLQEWLRGSYPKKSAHSKTVNILNNSYTGEYTRTERGLLNSYLADCYRTADREIEFEIRPDTKQVVYLSFSPSLIINESVPDITEEEARNKAKDIASQLIPNLSDYIQTNIPPDENTITKDDIEIPYISYVTTFTKQIDGFDSSDRITVSITSQGTLKYFSTGDINAFSNFKTAIDKNMLNQSVENKLNTIYGDVGYTVDEYTCPNQILALYPDGGVCIESTCYVTVSNETEKNIETAVAILTFIENKSV